MGYFECCVVDGGLLTGCSFDGPVEMELRALCIPESVHWELQMLVVLLSGHA